MQFYRIDLVIILINISSLENIYGKKISLNFPAVGFKVALHNVAHPTAVLCQENPCTIISASFRVTSEKNVCKNKHVYFMST